VKSPSRPTSLLVRGCHDADAFAAFYSAYSDRVLAFHARRVLDPEVAFDLMSETFAKALERRRQFRGQSAEEEQGWLFAIARGELSRYWKTGKVERQALVRWSIVVPPLSGPEHERIEGLAGISALDERLSEALALLPEDQRRAVHLRVLDERTYPEIACAMGVTEPTARARVSRGLRALARQLPKSRLLEETP
jgi:RNA polymerase sigma factor (sigma-70 family)